MPKLNDLISPEYQYQNKTLHERSLAAGKRWGDSGWSHADEVIKFADELAVKDILDYGCGQGTLKLELEKRHYNARVDEYDPSIPGKDKVPTMARDLVVCTDVMEHIEGEKVAAVLAHIYELSTKGAFFNIACTAAKAILPDGRNAHVTIMSPQWWVDQVKKLPWEVLRIEATNKKVKIWIKAHG